MCLLKSIEKIYIHALDLLMQEYCSHGNWVWILFTWVLM